MSLSLGRSYNLLPLLELFNINEPCGDSTKEDDSRRRERDTQAGDMQERRYSFRDFLLLRAVLGRNAAPEGHAGSGGFVSGWRLSALTYLRRYEAE